MRHKHNTTAAYENFFGGRGELVNQKSLSRITQTLKKNLLKLVLLLISNQERKKKAYQFLLCSVHIKVKLRENNTTLNTNH